MKILMIIPCLGRGGAERLVLNLSHRLQDMGHEVMIVTLRPESAYPELEHGLNIRTVRSKVYYSVLGKDVVDTEAFDLAVGEFGPDVIHSHLLDAELVSRHHTFPNISYITHWHGCPSLTEPIPFSRWMDRESVWKWNTKRILKRNYTRSRTHFLCISDFIGNYVKDRLGVKQSNITVVRNAIDTDLFKPLDVPKKDEFQLISIGSLHRNKNHSFLLQVMKALERLGMNDIHLDIYGDGPERAALQASITSQQLDGKVTLHGIVSDPELRLNQSHVLVHSAWHEPFGLIIIEAMACGIPVISFNTGGPAELIGDGETGFLIDKNDLKTYVDRIVLLYNNRDMIAEMGNRGMAHAQKFGMNDYAEQIEALYRRCLGPTKK